MGTRMMRVDWPVPVTLHTHPDVTDPRANQLRRSGDGAVQLLVGADIAVHVWLQDAAAPVSVRPGEALSGVTALELDDSSVIDDDTVASADGVFGGEPAASALTRTGNDVDDTILGQPAATRGDGDDADAVAVADTVIGAGRRRPETPTPGPDSPAVQVLPPPLPAIPGVLASAPPAAEAQAQAHAQPERDRRTRVGRADASGAPGASGPLVAANAVSLPDGRLVSLDRPVYVGRSPRSPRITSGLVPELVAVSSPRREVSATHLEIQQEGRAVVVRDLGSTNGTRVRVPGAAPSLLSPGSSLVVAAGTLLDLGDDIVLEIVAREDGGSW